MNEDTALEALYSLKEKWGKQYPFALRSWENNWDVISPFFKFPEEVREIVYTTNIIESLHRQFKESYKIKDYVSFGSVFRELVLL